MFKLIYGKPKSELYHKAFQRKFDVMIEADTIPQGTELMSLVYLGLRAITGAKRQDDRKDIKSLKSRLKAIETIHNLMSHMTLKQFVNVFPITKRYDGFNDYYSTMKLLKRFDMDAAIGDKIEDLLWGYLNEDITQFQRKLFKVVGDIARANGEPTQLQRFSLENGTPLYYVDKRRKELTGPIHIEEIDGQYYCDDSEAETVPLRNINKII